MIMTTKMADSAVSDQVATSNSDADSDCGDAVV